MKLAQELIMFGQQLAAANDAAHDLWSWLPSYKVAQKYHHDYAAEHCPSNRDVMIEAALYLASTKRPATTLTPEEREWFTRCPCGEDHLEESSTKEDATMTTNKPIESGARHVAGSIVVEETGGGNLRISKTHTPTDTIVIERADIDDLTVAIDAILGKRTS